ncbi:DUF2997 domain-containing protein [Paenibacillus xylanilyticus]|uniref:DUF2997 domain-containing protein n=1 Tax=Paenibacillus xylanilyticus TaxID=248903 RepID=A0A7Y6BVN0_9BACL|nr:DUF2997 domain-containing protein [Paenibacillus xylanilyticus]NUU75764.1 DUF2997 domain-containing protein [Paenibacillus xylanilyticus]
MKEVIILISPDGELTIEAIGYNGDGCEAATEPYEKGLGKVSERSFKSEYKLASSRTKSKSATRGGRTLR